MLERINSFVWGAPALILILGTGIYLSIGTRFAQLRLFPAAMRLFIKRLLGKGERDGAVSQFQALCTALAATVGTGNLAGVAGAIAIGGPGAVFWIWVSGVLGMVTKFAEATLAVRWRERNKGGEFVGGPMYMIERGMGRAWKPMAMLYCFFGAIASLGVGNATQINAVVSGINEVLSSYGVEHSGKMDIVISVILAFLICLFLYGGVRRIGKIAERLVPVAAAGYLLLCLLVLLPRHQMLIEALSAIVRGAFHPDAVTGGVVGSAFLALRTGISRGVFTNEAGMGTASIAHAAAEVRDPVEQGLMGMVEVFLDTIVICTMTALVILCSGTAVPYGADPGVILTTQAFSSVLGGWVCVPIALFLCAFAFATVLGWGLYGGRCVQYIFGERAWKPFVAVQGAVVILTVLLDTGTVWLLSEIVNGLMAVPNLIALCTLSPQLFKIMKKTQDGGHPVF